MAWTTFPTLTDGQILTGAHMQLVRDNFAETGPAKATTAGSWFVTASANSIAERIPKFSHISAGQITASTSFVDLGTIGPQVSTVTGAQAVLAFGCYVSNAVGGGGGYMAYDVSGATTVAADTTRALRLLSETAGTNQRASVVHWHPSLTPGTNVFTAKFATPTGGNCTFSDRHLIVFPF